MAPRRRNKEHRGLPERWRKKGETYFYRVPVGAEDKWDGKTEFRLGSTLEEAHRRFASMLASEPGSFEAKTVGKLLDKFVLLVLPNMAPTTQRVTQSELKNLRKVFAEMPLETLEPIHAHKYYTARSAKVAAKREVSTLRSALSYGVQWGDIRENPLRELRIKSTAKVKDKRYVTDDEILTLLNHTDSSQYGTSMCQAYVKLKLLTGLRKADMLRLTMSDIKEDGLFSQTSKSNKGLLFTWTDALRSAVDEAVAVRPALSQYLFCTRRGECMVTETGRTGAFDSLWKDFILRVKEKCADLQHFTEHDLRGKVGSDAESDERAAQLLGHSTADVTRKHYRRKVATIKPTK